MPPNCQDLFETLMQSAPGGNMEGLMGKECWFGDGTDVTWGVSSKAHRSTWAALSQLCLHAMMQRTYALDVDQRGQCFDLEKSPPGLDTLLFSLVATWKKSVDLSPSSSVGWNSVRLGKRMKVSKEWKNLSVKTKTIHSQVMWFLHMWSWRSTFPGISGCSKTPRQVGTPGRFSVVDILSIWWAGTCSGSLW